MNKKPITRVLRGRLIILSIVIFVLFSLLLVQFYKIQIFEGNKWRNQANRQHYFVVTEPFSRGRFFSNNSLGRFHPDKPQLLVGDVQKYHLHIDPINIPIERRQKMITVLSSQLAPTERERLKIAEQFKKKSRNRKIATWLSKEKRDRIESWWRAYARKHRIAKNALFFVADTERSYPFGNLMGQVLHTVQHRKDEKTKQAIPTGGLELYYHELLKGAQGKKRLMRSPRHSLEIGEMITQPRDGSDIYLSTNPALQSIVEEELEKGVKKYLAKGGWAAMMNPFSGEILALAQYPFFYPPDYPKYFNQIKEIDNTRVKAVTDANEPGSIMKPITLAISLLANEELNKRGEAALFDPEEMMPTANGKFPGRKKPLKDVGFHKYLNMNMGLQKSSNIYMARLYERLTSRLGSHWCREQMKNTFGLGTKTGIELPSETAGVIPTPGKLHPNGTLEWSMSTPYSLAMGHNLQTNSLQLLRAYAVFANGGYLVRPTLVKGQFEFQPKVLPDSVLNRVLEAMRYVIRPGGSGWRADVYGYTKVGKSGTADKILNGRYVPEKVCASFIGFTPLSHPEFVLIVTLDEPSFAYIQGLGRRHYGGACCAPVFKAIARRSLEYLGTPKDDPYGYPPGDPRFDSTKAIWHTETQSLKEKYEKWNK